MARYSKTLSMVDYQANSFAQIQQYLTGKGFKYHLRDGEQVFQKGDGVWLVAKFVKVTYSYNQVRVEAWIDNLGMEQDLEGFVASAAKKPLKKIVAQVEEILTRPNGAYISQDQPQTTVAEEGDFCAQCGTALVPGGRFCPKCAHEVGVPVEKTMTRLPEGTTKKEYFKKHAGESFQKNVKTAAIIGYVCAGINAVISVLLMPLGLIDSLLFLGLALGMHLGKSKGCAIGMLIYSIFTVMVGLVMNGTFGGWLWVVAGVTAVIVFNNEEKRYKELIKNA